MTTNQNNSVTSYVRLQLDDSFIDKCFHHVDKKLNRHEELINELMRLLKNKADLSDLENLKLSLLKTMDEKIDEKIDNRLSEFESKFDEKLDKTKSDLIMNFNNSIEKLTTNFEEKLKELNDRLNQLEKLSEFGTSIQQQFDEMKERVEAIEKNLENEINITQNHQNSINSIILSFGGLNDQDLSENLLNDFSKSSKIVSKSQSKSSIKAPINNDSNSNADSDSNINSSTNETDNTNNLHNSKLTNVLKSSTTYVSDELKSLRDELQKLKDEMQIQSIMNRQTPKTEPSSSPPPIVIPSSPKPKISPQPSPKSPVIQKPPQSTKIIKMKDTSNNFNINDFIKGHNFIDFDFLSCHPRNLPIVHWTDPPELPKLEQLRDMFSFVDYFYRFVPKLQAHLTAIHQKVVENSADILGKCDKAIVEKMFDKFQNIVNEMRKRLNDLKEAVEQTASREEINQMVDELLMRMGSDSETAAGCVKCIACGRDVAIVTGARTEKDLQRILGSPPNSIVRSNQIRSSLTALPANAGINVSTGNNNNNSTIRSNGIKVTYTSRDGFDSEIVESPRSIRPSRMKAPH